jgi:hypothetical protein
LFKEAWELGFNPGLTKQHRYMREGLSYCGYQLFLLRKFKNSESSDRRMVVSVFKDFL